MKTKISKMKMKAFVLLIGAVVICFGSCKTTQNNKGNKKGAEHGMSCPSKKCHHQNKIFSGDRVYYDFRTKQIYKDKEHKKIQKKPLLMREGSEIQIEISGFNPLNYSIMIADTAYDRFETNIEDFCKYITYPKLPDIDTNISKSVIDTALKSDTVIRFYQSDKCQSINSYIDKINKKSQLLNTNITSYKRYLSCIENINSCYEYMKLLDVINKSEIESVLKSNVFDPVNNILPEDMQLKTSSSEVFRSDFIELELYYYKPVNKLKSELKVLRDSVDLLKAGSCKSFIEKKKLFNDSYQSILMELEVFDSARINKVLPNFTKTMIVYEKLQSLAANEPLYVTTSVPISKDVQTINIYKYNPETKVKEPYDALSVQLTRGFRIDVSGGLFVSGLSDYKYNPYTKDSIFTSTYLSSGTIRDTLISDKFTAFYKEKNLKVSYGGMIFLHGHSQNSSMFNYGGYLGLGALFNEKTRWAGSLGFSLIIGRSQRCFIDIGAVISQVDRLKKPYIADNFYQGVINEVPDAQVWRASWMLGVSWKIGK